jgi:hypothetical protein
LNYIRRPRVNNKSRLSVETKAIGKVETTAEKEQKQKYWKKLDQLKCNICYVQAGIYNL